MPNLSMKTVISADHVLCVVLPAEFPVGAVRITLEPIAIEADQGFQPQTDFGRCLWEIC